MAVHTPLLRQQIADFLLPYQLGELIDHSGISDGLENTNYFIRVKHFSNDINDYVLTVFEKLPRDDVGFYLQLMSHLAQGGLPVAKPVALPITHSPTLSTLLGKPAAIVGKLCGTHLQQPTSAQCFALGKILAQQHQLCKGLIYRGSQQLHTILEDGRKLKYRVSVDDHELFEQALKDAQQFLADPDLPRGIIHGDLFRDNVLFDGDKVSGLLDFYNATYAPLLLDIAITVNDWCSDSPQSLDNALVNALLSGYESIRPLEIDERKQWQNSLRFAALRFWISRLRFQQQLRDAKDGSHFPHKDPEEFRQRYLFLSAPHK